VSGGIGEHVLAVELSGAERKDTRRRHGDALHHDVEVHLLRDGRVWPGGWAMVGGELKCQSGCRVILGDHDEVFAVIGDGLAQQFRIEPAERSRIWTIEDEVVNSPEHAPMVSLVTECRQAFSHQRR